MATNVQLGVKRQWLKEYLEADDKRSVALYKDSQQVMRGGTFSLSFATRRPFQSIVVTMLPLRLALSYTRANPPAHVRGRAIRIVIRPRAGATRSFRRARTWRICGTTGAAVALATCPEALAAAARR